MRYFLLAFLFLTACADRVYTRGDILRNPDTGEDIKLEFTGSCEYVDNTAMEIAYMDTNYPVEVVTTDTLGASGCISYFISDFEIVAQEKATLHIMPISYVEGWRKVN